MFTKSELKKAGISRYNRRESSGKAFGIVMSFEDKT